jgi:hypothetical protein
LLSAGLSWQAISETNKIILKVFVEIGFMIFEIALRKL